MVPEQYFTLFIIIGITCVIAVYPLYFNVLVVMIVSAFWRHIIWYPELYWTSKVLCKLQQLKHSLPQWPFEQIIEMSWMLEKIRKLSGVSWLALNLNLPKHNNHCKHSLHSPNHFLIFSTFQTCAEKAIGAENVCE